MNGLPIDLTDVGCGESVLDAVADFVLLRWSRRPDAAVNAVDVWELLSLALATALRHPEWVAALLQADALRLECDEGEGLAGHLRAYGEDWPRRFPLSAEVAR